MTIHITLQGFLSLVGGAVIGAFGVAALYGAWLLWRWGK